MEYMIRFTQVHETFRLAEIHALAVLENMNLEILSYSPTSPFCFIKVPSEEAAIRLVRRSILAKSIYEVWGKGENYVEVHANVHNISSHLWPLYKDASFKFSFDAFQGSRTVTEQRKLIEGFHFLGFEGPIKMKGAEQDFCICEDWKFDAVGLGVLEPESIYLGRYLGGSERDIVGKYDLKKRKYICTTSMDAELALITANITLAAPGKLFYDPFVGSGSFPVAAAHFGALAFGSDIDGRSIRGKGKSNLLANFVQYGLTNQFGDSFVADLTNTPLRTARIFDGIVCDPPYGVREGLKVLGSRDSTKGKEVVFRDGKAHHEEDSYIPPKRPYSFLAMLDDILEFASISLVDHGRLSFWMPTANDQDQEIKIPQHPCLQITRSRRLITYRRIPDAEVVAGDARTERARENGVNADDLNPFRKGYFKGFKPILR
ncbi:probable TRM11 Catalytic subunit of an adoMet-dependent tRNA methyltransferase complex (Trm11p-Trm112p) [Phialocephala subalpina]|uniref:tRNA (guanine(10)-N(2))-methyltransferase n=1 Tax=Phialocephala subalpina TaxID=576137 RepID=A0A1L7XAQ8_9HELO|nr:probable TRM11 Catalytic subunit of an adoMet-dependent tRNA methyltransferase complex (Trm11p-Trm112p) [Phialocephala subalpina]